MTPFSIANNSRILSCSNGLMLLECDYDYYIHNPTTKQSKKLSLAHNDEFSLVASLHLVFDPSKSLHYKIVCIRAEYEPRMRQQVEGEWSVCVEPFARGEITSFAACVECRSLIFLIYRQTSFGCVYCFDVVRNVSDIILVPKLARDAYSHSLQVSDGRLYYCALIRNDGPHRTSAAVWELRVDVGDPRRSNWLLKYDPRDHRLREGLGSNLLTFIAETRSILIRVPGKIVAYNFYDKSYKEFLQLEPQISSLNVHQLGYQTLAPL